MAFRWDGYAIRYAHIERRSSGESTYLRLCKIKQRDNNVYWCESTGHASRVLRRAAPTDQYWHWGGSDEIIQLYLSVTFPRVHISYRCERNANTLEDLRGAILFARWRKWILWALYASRSTSPRVLCKQMSLCYFFQLSDETSKSLACC